MTKKNISVSAFPVADFAQIKVLRLRFGHEHRFFELTGNDKGATPKGWSDPNNQKRFAELPRKFPVGCDISGHGIRDEYCVLDFDRVMNEQGEFVNERVAACVADLRNSFEDLYGEYSASKRGLHFILKPTADKFKRMSPAVLYFDDEQKADSPKMEIYFKSSAKYFIFTGILYPRLNRGFEVPSGDVADNWLNKILAEIKKQKPTKKKSATAKSAVKTEYTDSDCSILSTNADTVNNENQSKSRENDFGADCNTKDVSLQGNLKELAEEIKRQDTKIVADKYLSPARNKGYICDCGNGTKASGTGAEIYFNTHHNRTELKCQSCGKNLNNLQIIAYGENLNLDDKDELRQAVKIGCEIYGLSFDTDSPARSVQAFQDTTTTAADDEEVELIHNDIHNAQNYLASFVEKHSGNFRGLTYETLKRFGCGFLPKWIHPKTRLEFERGEKDKLPIPSQRFIISTLNHYNAVMLPNDRTPENKKFHKMHAGSKEIFGAEFLPIKVELIIVTEGEIDAMSIWQATGGNYYAIATGGAADKRIIQFLQTKYKTHKPKILILFDCDETGRLNAPKLRKSLLDVGFPAVFKFLSTEESKTDANDILINKGNEALAKIISSIVDSAQNDFVDAQNEFTQSDNSLENKLRDVNEKISEFEQEKSAAIEKIKSLETFDQATVLADKENVKAAAFCKLYDKDTFLKLKADIQQQIKLQGTTKFISDWAEEIREKAAEIKDRQAELKAQKDSITAKIISNKFIATYDELKDFIVPDDYEVSPNGIIKYGGEKPERVSKVPAFICGKQKSVTDETFKTVLAYLNENGKWQKVPATGEEIVFNARKLIDLRAYGFPVTSNNANRFVEYLDDFKLANDKILPFSFTVPCCGWYNFDAEDLGLQAGTLPEQDFFIDPRRKNTFVDGDRNIDFVVDSSSTFAKSLKSKGSIKEWRKAYDIVKKSPIARLIAAAGVAAPLLKLVGERNFMLYIHANTRAGKSTAMQFAASAVGNNKIIRSFDGTKIGLIGAAADLNDNVFILDEKQAADESLKKQISLLIYSLTNGVGRTKLNRDSSLKQLQDWRVIVLANGETELVPDNATGGAFTRVLQIHAPNIILPADDCATIKTIIADNYGLILPLVIEKYIENRDYLNDKYKYAVDTFIKVYHWILPEYCRYMAILTVADCMLNYVLGENKEAAYMDALSNADEILKLIPTKEDISDTAREKDFVLGFIAANVAHFFGSVTYNKTNGKDIYGKFADDYVYISTAILKQACASGSFDCKKLVFDLISDGFFKPDDKIFSGRNKPADTVQIKICGVNTRCFRIEKKLIAD